MSTYVVSRCIAPMYRETDVYICPHVVTQSNIDTSPYTYVSRCITIHRYNAIHRYTCITTPQVPAPPCHSPSVFPSQPARAPSCVSPRTSHPCVAAVAGALVVPPILSGVHFARERPLLPASPRTAAARSGSHAGGDLIPRSA